MSENSLAMQVQSVLEKKAKVPIENKIVLLRVKRADMQVKLLDVPDDTTVIRADIAIGSLIGVNPCACRADSKVSDRARNDPGESLRMQGRRTDCSART